MNNTPVKKANVIWISGKVIMENSLLTPHQQNARCHTARRLFEHYGIQVDSRTMRNVRRMIDLGSQPRDVTGLPILEFSPCHFLWEVYLQNYDTIIYPIFDHELNEIVTVLAPDAKDVKMAKDVTYVDIDPDTGEPIQTKRGLQAPPKWRVPATPWEKDLLMVFHLTGAVLFPKEDRDLRTKISTMGRSIISIKSVNNFDTAITHWDQSPLYIEEWINYTIAWAKSKRARHEYVDLRGWYSFATRLEAMLKWLEKNKLLPAPVQDPAQMFKVDPKVFEMEDANDHTTVLDPDEADPLV